MRRLLLRVSFAVITFAAAVAALSITTQWLHSNAQTYAQEGRMRKTSMAAAADCVPFAVLDRCSGSLAMYDERACAEGKRERVEFFECTPEKWLRVGSRVEYVDQRYQLQQK